MTLGEVRRVLGLDGGGQVVRALASLDRLDYADVFTLATATAVAPEDWARAMFGDSPTAVERLIWRGCLGMPLSPSPAPDVIAGWPVDGRGRNWIRLHNASPMMAGNLVIHIGDGEVSLGTFIRYDRRRGQLVWAVLAPLHRRLAPGLLRDAEATVQRRRSPQGGIH